MSSQMIQIIVLAGVATRDGFEQTNDPQKIQPQPQRGPGDFAVIEGGPDPDIAEYADPDSKMGKALAAMKRVEPSFSVTEFAGGARHAYEMILMAYEKGDTDVLRDFLSPDVFEGFRGAVEAREDQGLRVDAEFLGVRELKITDADFDEENSEAEIVVRFVGEMTSVVKDTEGRIQEGTPDEAKRQRDIWTFARLMGTDNPNWLLVATER